jgi:hypothetical protein
MNKIKLIKAPKKSFVTFIAKGVKGAECSLTIKPSPQYEPTDYDAALHRIETPSFKEWLLRVCEIARDMKMPAHVHVHGGKENRADFFLVLDVEGYLIDCGPYDSDLGIDCKADFYFDTNTSLLTKNHEATRNKILAAFKQQLKGPIRNTDKKLAKLQNRKNQLTQLSSRIEKALNK